jgi:hypothetical protein
VGGPWTSATTAIVLDVLAAIPFALVVWQWSMILTAEGIGSQTLRRRSIPCIAARELKSWM